jgi:hypothetical protein
MKNNDLLDTNLVEAVSGETASYLPTPATNKLTRVTYTVWNRVRPDKISLFLASLFLFILAIMLMKEGARGLTFLVRD